MLVFHSAIMNIKKSIRLRIVASQVKPIPVLISSSKMIHGFQVTFENNLEIMMKIRKYSDGVVGL